MNEASFILGTFSKDIKMVAAKCFIEYIQLLSSFPSNKFAFSWTVSCLVSQMVPLLSPSFIKSFLSPFSILIYRNNAFKIEMLLPFSSSSAKEISLKCFIKGSLRLMRTFTCILICAHISALPYYYPQNNLHQAFHLDGVITSIVSTILIILYVFRA